MERPGTDNPTGIRTLFHSNGIFVRLNDENYISTSWDMYYDNQILPTDSWNDQHIV